MRQRSDLMMGAPMTPPKNDPIELNRVPPRAFSEPTTASPVNSYALALALSALRSLAASPAGLYQLAPASLVRATKALASMPSRWPMLIRS
jgi:hypothetical protein